MSLTGGLLEGGWEYSLNDTDKDHFDTTSPDLVPIHGDEDPLVNVQMNRGFAISFEYVASRQPDGTNFRRVYFPAFLTDFKDNFASDWNDEFVLGRMDPICTFKRTTRQISIGWTIIANNVFVAQDNTLKCNQLLQMLYPEYESDGMSAVMKTAPLIRIKFANLVTNTGQKMQEGLIGVVRGFVYTPSLEDGFFDPKHGILFPKSIAFNCEFTVLHTHPLGTNITKGMQFPYRLEKEETLNSKNDLKATKENTGYDKSAAIDQQMSEKTKEAAQDNKDTKESVAVEWGL